MMPLCTTAILPSQLAWRVRVRHARLPVRRPTRMTDTAGRGVVATASSLSRPSTLPTRRTTSRRAAPVPASRFSNATPAESYPRYSRRLSPVSRMSLAVSDPVYPTIPHICSTLSICARRRVRAVSVMPAAASAAAARPAPGPDDEASAAYCNEGTGRTAPSGISFFDTTSSVNENAIAKPQDMNARRPHPLQKLKRFNDGLETGTIEADNAWRRCRTVQEVPWAR